MKDQYVHMKSVPVSLARAEFSALIERVIGGESVLITRRGRPVVRLEPCNAGPGSDQARIDYLIAQGLLVPPRNPADPTEILAEPGPKLPAGVNASEYIVAEREDSP